MVEDSIQVVLSVPLTSLEFEKSYDVELTIESVLSTSSVQKTFGN